MFGRKPFSSFDFDAVSEKEALELLREEMKKAIIHFGEGRVNPSTIASIFALIEERVTQHLPLRCSTSSEGRYLLETIGLCGNTKNKKP